MSLKYYLKQAKSCISSGDAETALEYVQDVLQIEPNNYFAFIFLGKSNQLLENWKAASDSFAKATSIEPDNLLGWKGYFQTAISSGDHQLFFQILGLYINKQYQLDLPLADTIKEAKNYLHFYNVKKDMDLNEKYLLFLSLGVLPDELAALFLPKVEVYRQLLTVTKRREDLLLKDLVNKQKMKMPPRLTPSDSRLLIADVKWTIYKNLSVDHLFELFINICDDDEERANTEEDWAKYKYDLLLSAPEKTAIATQLWDLIEGMVLVKRRSLFAWSLYFDWNDLTSLAELDLNNILFFLDNFGHEGLGIVINAFIVSDLSPFDRTKVLDELAKQLQKKIKKQQHDEDHSDNDEVDLDKSANEDEKELDQLDADAPEVIEYDPALTLAMINDGLSRCPTSIFAARIACKYLIHQQEYDLGSVRCKEAIHLLAENQRSTGIDLAHIREDVLCSLAIVYTYHEAPKNHSKALTLYNKILEDNPDNSQAAVGKGLILIEKEQFPEAKIILQEATNRFPDHLESKVELSWCFVKMGDLEKGRQGLLSCVEQAQGNSIRNLEMRALLNWRIAESFNKDDTVDNAEEEFKFLVQALKESPNFAPAYTSLGLLYQNHYLDQERAQKCFYRAFELDVAEITGARHLVQDLAEREEWDVAEILCRRIVSSDRLRRVLLTKKSVEDRSWPYRVLGCLALNKQEDSKAVEWFQTALRMASMDQECWLGLGEAYYNCGRLDAAAKVLIHASEMIKGNPWEVNYLLGKVMSEMGSYEAAIGYLKIALQSSPNEECVVNLLYETMILNSGSLILQGFFGRAFASNLEAVEYLHLAVKTNCKSQRLWKAVSDSLRLFMITQDHALDFPFEKFESIILYAPESDNQFLVEISQKSVLKGKPQNLKFSAKLANLSIEASKGAVRALPPRLHKLLRSMSYYNVGLSYLEAFKLEPLETGFREAAVLAIKKALQIEPSNATYWTALGNGFASLNPQLSQHCFIKASGLDSRDASIWSNLAALYLRYGDHELAEEAFLRALSVAPTESVSWVGHALAAQSAGKDLASSSLFTHAYILSNGRNPLAQLLYGLSVLNKRLQSGCDPRDIEAAQEFSVANFAMLNYMKFNPDDVVGLQIAIIISERCKNYEKGIELGLKLSNILEKKYEETESTKILEDFTQSRALVARMYLGIGDYERALEHAQFALDVAGEEEGHDSELANIIVSSRITIGLVYFFQDRFDDSLDQLKLIISRHADSRRLVTLTAQILFAFKTEETKLAAIDQLFAHIEEYGSNLLVALTLGAISVVDNLEEYLEPIKEELEGLSLEELVNDSIKIVPRLVDEIDRRLGMRSGDIWKKNALLFPGDYHVWKHVSSTMAIQVATLSDTKLAASETAGAYCEVGELRAIQRSLVLNPGSQEARRALEGCI